MKEKFSDKVKKKALEWINDPIGDIPSLDPPPETHLKAPAETFELLRPEPKRKGSRGGKQEIPPHMEEFHHRGGAGQREYHARKGRKISIPFRGKGSKIERRGKKRGG
jgi:hypothetical protein